jgi:hypothetical protein
MSRCISDFECSFERKCCPNACGSTSCAESGPISYGFDQRDDSKYISSVRSQLYGAKPFMRSWQYGQPVKYTALYCTRNSLYHMHKSSSLAVILRQINSAHLLPHYFLEVRLNIMLPSTARSSKLTIPSRLCNQNLVRISHLPPCARRTTLNSSSDLIIEWHLMESTIRGSHLSIM